MPQTQTFKLGGGQDGGLSACMLWQHWQKFLKTFQIRTNSPHGRCGLWAEMPNEGKVIKTKEYGPTLSKSFKEAATSKLAVNKLTARRQYTRHFYNMMASVLWLKVHVFKKRLRSNEESSMQSILGGSKSTNKKISWKTWTFRLERTAPSFAVWLL